MKPTKGEKLKLVKKKIKRKKEERKSKLLLSEVE